MSDMCESLLCALSWCATGLGHWPAVFSASVLLRAGRFILPIFLLMLSVNPALVKLQQVRLDGAEFTTES